MKLTRPKLLETLRILEEGGTAYQARKITGVSLSRVYQIWNYYKRTGEIPNIGKTAGRPERQILPEEEFIIRKAYEKYRVCASRLRKFIKGDYNTDISHCHIHKVLLKLGFARSNGRKDVRRKKWIRYERRHSLTAVHLDWYLDKKTRLWVLPIIDDSSRKLLALVECKSATTDASINAMKEALKHGEIAQCISDHGTQFWKGEDMKSRFPAFLMTQGIKHIPTKIKHPQSNGKSEKFNDLYKNHRHAFDTKEAFISWYNEVRPHMSLDEETPEFIYQKRKKKGRVYYT